MTAYQLSPVRVAVRRTATGHSAAAWTRRVATTLGEWRRRHRERNQLLALDPRMLKDIGITRTDAMFLGNKPFWKE
jgi:uncharacterized protein YjiS (DUF1127 family)